MRRALLATLFFVILVAIWHFVVQANVWSPVRTRMTILVSVVEMKPPLWRFPSSRWTCVCWPG